jgi:hypothetical protein
MMVMVKLSSNVNFTALANNTIFDLQCSKFNDCNIDYSNCVSLPAENIVSIDYRPAINCMPVQRIYFINEKSGVATAVEKRFTPAIVGQTLLDFNPTVDRIV